MRRLNIATLVATLICLPIFSAEADTWVQRTKHIRASRLPIAGPVTYDRMLETQVSWTTLHWRWNHSGDGLLHIAVRGKTDGWLALSFTKRVGMMVPATAVVALPAAREVVVASLVDRRPDGVHQPEGLASDIGLVHASRERSNGYTVLRLALDTEQYDQQLTAINIARHTTSPTLGFHDVHSALSLEVDFATALFAREKMLTQLDVRLGRLHGALMIAAWCYLLPFAILVKRYGKSVLLMGNSISTKVGLGSAFKTHVAIAVLGLCFTLSGFCVAVTDMRDLTEGDGDSDGGNLAMGLPMIDTSAWPDLNKTYWPVVGDADGVGDAKDGGDADGDGKDGDDAGSDGDGDTDGDGKDGDDADGDDADGDGDTDGDGKDGDDAGDGTDGDGLQTGDGDADASTSDPWTPINHKKMAWGIVFTALAMPFLGVLLPLFAPSKASPLRRQVLSLIHTVIGRSLAVVCIIQVFTGIKRLGDRDSETQFHMALAAVIGLSANLTLLVLFEVLARVYFVTRKDQKDEVVSSTEIRLAWAEVNTHDQKADNPWVVINGKVLSVRDWVSQHPGGSEVILQQAGQDATAAFNSFNHSSRARGVLERYEIGTVEDERMTSAITVAGGIAESLVKLDLREAERLLGLNVSDMPHNLTGAFAELVENISSFLPYLPSALVENLRTDQMPPERRDSGLVNATLRSAFEAEPPDVVALAFTDIQKSTQLWEAHPTAMKVALDQHNDMLRRCIYKCDGYEIKTIGDAFMVAFSTAGDGLRFANMAQQMLAENPWPEEILADNNVSEDGPLIRIGLHYGPANAQRNPVSGTIDYFGPNVNKAARIEGVAAGGCTCVSEELLSGLTEEERQELPNMDLTPIGKAPLKGVTDLSSLSFVLPIALQKRKNGALSHLMKSKQVKKDSRASAYQETVSNITSTGMKKVRHAKHLVKGLGTSATVLSNYSFLLNEENANNALIALVAVQFEVASRTDGVIQSFSGESLLLMWNLQKPCAAHAVTAARFSVLLSSECEALWVDSSTPFSAPRYLSIGLATGRVVHGRVGVAQQMSLLTLGGVLELSSRLAHFAKRVGAHVLVSALPGFFSVVEDMSIAGSTRVLDVWACGANSEIEIAELNILDLRNAVTAWGFDSEAPADKTWSPAFQQLVITAYKGDAAAAKEASEVLHAEREARTCDSCTHGSMTLWRCLDCRKTVCTSCAAGACYHVKVGDPRGSAAPFCFLMHAMDSIAQGEPNTRTTFNPELALLEEPGDEWLGKRQGSTCTPGQSAALFSPPSAGVKTPRTMDDLRPMNLPQMPSMD